jgi:hypothetical protein
MKEHYGKNHLSQVYHVPVPLYYHQFLNRILSLHLPFLDHLQRFVRIIIEESQSQGGSRFQCPKEKRKEIIENVAETYYKESNPVVFDTNRGWTYLTLCSLIYIQIQK